MYDFYKKFVKKKETMDKNVEKSVLGELPSNYKLSQTLDLKNNKKQFLLINGASILSAIILIVPMLFIVPIDSLFIIDYSEGGGGIWLYILRFLLLVLGSTLYITLHELTHGLMMKLFGARKVKFGFNVVYAYAGSKEEYFRKWPYIIVALAPVTIFFVIFAVICPFIYKTPWFWMVYFWQVQNVAGAAGDIIVSIMFLSKPKNSYIKDEGTSMQLYTPRD